MLNVLYSTLALIIDTQPLPLKLTLSVSMHEPILSLSLRMREPMLSLSMLVLDPSRTERHADIGYSTLALNIEIQHWHATLTFNIGTQHWH